MSWRDLPDVAPKAKAKADWRALPDAKPLAAPPLEPGAPPDSGGEEVDVADDGVNPAAGTHKARMTTVETPTGTARMLEGRPVMSHDDIAQQTAAGGSRAKTYMLEQALTAANSGAQGIVPAVSGAIGAVKRQFSSDVPPESLAQSYRKARGDAEDTTSRAEESAGLPAMVAGALPAMAVGMPSTIWARLALNAGLGAVNGASRSAGDVTKEGGITRIAKDAGRSAGISSAIGLGGEGLSAIGGWLGGKLGQEANGAAAAQFAKRNMEASDKAASLRSTVAGESTKASALLKRIDHALDHPEMYSAADVAAARAMAMDPDVIALRSISLRNATSAVKPQMGFINQARDMAEEAATGIAGKAAALTAQDLAPSSVAARLGESAWKSIGQRALMGAGGAAAGGLIGGALGDHKAEGGVLGAAIGAIAPGALQMMRNKASDPTVQHLFNRGMQGAVNTGTAATQGATQLGARMTPGLDIDRRKAWTSVLDDIGNTGGQGLGSYAEMFRALPQENWQALNEALLLQDPNYAAKVKTLGVR